MKHAEGCRSRLSNWPQAPRLIGGPLEGPTELRNAFWHESKTTLILPPAFDSRMDLWELSRRTSVIGAHPNPNEARILSAVQPTAIPTKKLCR